MFCTQNKILYLLNAINLYFSRFSMSSSLHYHKQSPMYILWESFFAVYAFHSLEAQNKQSLNWQTTWVIGSASPTEVQTAIPRTVDSLVRPSPDLSEARENPIQPVHRSLPAAAPELTQSRGSLSAPVDTSSTQARSPIFCWKARVSEGAGGGSVRLVRLIRKKRLRRKQRWLVVLPCLKRCDGAGQKVAVFCVQHNKTVMATSGKENYNNDCSYDYSSGYS